MASTKKAVKTGKSSKSTAKKKSTPSTASKAKSSSKSAEPAPNEEAARDLKLEAAMRGDPEAVAVYIDWLQQHGNPAGELASLHKAMGDLVDPRYRVTKAVAKTIAKHEKRAAALRTELGFPGEDFAKITWRDGAFQIVHLDNQIDHMDAKFDSAALAAPVFASPLCATIDELRIGTMRWDFNHEDVPAMIAVAAKYPWAKHLPRLFLGACDNNIDMAHHVIGTVGAAITKAFPKLEWLKLHSGDQSWRASNSFDFAKLDLPHLHTLIIETCAMTKKRLASLVPAKLPKLTTLELWFGDSGRDCDVKLNHVFPILDGKFPNVVHLGLRNSDLADALCTALATSKIASRLETLDLSMGTLGESGARALCNSRDVYKNLKQLDLRDNFLTAEYLEVIEEAFAGVNVIYDNQKDDIPGDPPDRFVTVGE